MYSLLYTQRDTHQFSYNPYGFDDFIWFKCYFLTFYGNPYKINSCIKAYFIVNRYYGDHLTIFYIKSMNVAGTFVESILLEIGNFGGYFGNTNYYARSHLLKKCFGGGPNVYFSIYICYYSHLAGNKGVPVNISYAKHPVLHTSIFSSYGLTKTI